MENVQKISGTAKWSDERGAWIVLVVDEVTGREGHFQVEACDEFVIPLTIIEFNGYNTKEIYKECDWYAENID